MPDNKIKPFFFRPTTPELRQRIIESAGVYGQSYNERIGELINNALAIEDRYHRNRAIQEAIITLRGAGIPEAAIQEAIRVLQGY